MRKFLRKLYYTLAGSFLSHVLAPIVQGVSFLHYHLLHISLKLSGAKMPSKEDILLMQKNVTFIYKSFERQKMAVELYHNIQRFYPGVKVIIADDSKMPLDLQDDHVSVIQLPFNSGLSRGLNCALAEVTTPFVIRMDDDELLTLRTNFHRQLRFLLSHPEADLAAVSCYSALHLRSHQRCVNGFYKYSMADAPKSLKIPHMTFLDDTHVVCGIVPQVFIARTKSLQSIGYDDNIRMADHHEFFFRAAGNIVSTLANDSYVFHRHNQFDKKYAKYRSDISADNQYIRQKIALLKKSAHIQSTDMD